MGFREAVLLVFVLFLFGGNSCAATQNWSNSTTNDTLNQIPQEQEAASLQLPRSLQADDGGSNWTQPGGPVRSFVTYRLTVHQLRKQASARPLEDASLSPHVSEADVLAHEEQVEPESTVPPQELVKLVQGPDLNPPVEPESKVQPRMFQQRGPVAAASVVARCGEGEVAVEVKQNFLGNGQLIRPSDLTLGGCAALDADDHIHFQSELQDCGSTMRMTEETLIYSFSLIYSPIPIGNTFIFKTNPAEVVIECHYQRKLYVSSGPLRPTWTLFASSMLAQQQLHFSLRFMTEDWQSQRPSRVYLVSEVMQIEAAGRQGHHVPLRVHVDSCVATVSPDPNSQPAYPFISNHGCLSDAKMTGAKSYFMQRRQEDKLHFQLKAFSFPHDHRNSFYITCLLKATQVSKPIDLQNKACSFLTEANRWVASGGDNAVCGCCETSCSEQRQKRSLAADVEPQREGTVAQGPILLEELTELQTQAASRQSTALLCGVCASLAALLLAFMGASICGRCYKPTGHFVCT
ncbi:zona pellucida sperm-binding protein 3-like isoform X1 [Anarrhichthys ocellatus]|uniref:zona pellucida sperm-binding protein 3-like isoform X1 n=1 Tax=Anarrhichthys ocellatus TaxID=433405 RepID=UPI0012EE2CA8|nr:zona pellucida sperm-binding protein 3-like isoform X1 [Anarrhichthys ocellatus]